MTATAQGARLACDQTGCHKPGTVEHEAWVFCDEHARTSRTQPAPATARTRPVAVPATLGHASGAAPSPAQAPGKPVVDLSTLTPAEIQHGIRPAASSPLGLLLEQASGHSVAKVRRLAEKIEAQLADLRTLVEQHAADEQRRKDEAEAREKARAEVERLEKQLAAAKAKLRPTKKAAAPKAASPGIRVVDGVATGTQLCTGCQGFVTRPAGTRGQWPAKCSACRASG